MLRDEVGRRLVVPTASGRRGGSVQRSVGWNDRFVRGDCAVSRDVEDLAS